VGPAALGQAAAMFVVTNVDDLVLLAVFFGRAGRSRSALVGVVLGQYVGLLAILGVSIVAALGVRALPDGAIGYLGLVPLLLGLRAAWQAWRDTVETPSVPARGVRTWEVAAVTFANGGDNVGVYVPVFAVVGSVAMAGYVVVFLMATALWCVLGWCLATRPVVARLLARWGHVVLPVVLIAIGLVIIIEGGAFGL
jgi:cadmium resistance protein CadD (predicted permease)